MKLLIHDLDEEQQARLKISKDTTVISDSGKIRHCIGCFGCWLKTPAACVIRDEYGNMGELLSKSSEVQIISRCVYGSYSPFVKNVFDRSISYVLPYFKKRNGELHHKPRYSSNFSLSVIFYGNNITEAEKSTATGLINANCENLDCNHKGIKFIKDISELEGMEI